ncbi:MAG: hypothetical protein HKP44_04225 [Desulfofustis sp.]|nr:hypothetical protein [Desulfofustis sp.]
MNGSKENSFDMNEAISAWMKFTADVWGPMVSQMVNQTTDFWSEGTDKPGKGFRSDRSGTTKSQAAMSAALNNWQAMATALSSSESVDALLKGSGAMPEMLLKLGQTSYSGSLQLQQKIIERISRLGESTEAYKFEDIDENIFRMWTDIYENEFRQFLHVPQLGLLRAYQEKVSVAADKYALFQASLSEFLRLLAMPFHRSMQVMQEKLTEMAEQGTLPDDTKEYYTLWIKVLEGHFMTLFQNPEYVETLSRTINDLAEFVAARDAALEDIIGLLPVARKSEVDELSEDIYELKKRLRRLERKSQEQP